MKRLLLAIALLVAPSSAWALCSQIPLNVKDAASNTVAMSSATAADGNCKTYIDADTSSQLHADMTAAIPAGTNIIGKVGIDQTTPGTTNGVQVNAALPAGTNTIGSVKQTDGTTVVITDPCQGVAKTYTPINVSASGSVKIITGTAAKKTYICHIHLVTNAANNVALTEGTGVNCGTGTAGVIGGTTAASGWNFSANGGISIGSGGYASIGTATNADDICLNPSATTQLSGQVVWVQQ